MKKTPQTLQSRVVYQSKVFNVREDRVRTDEAEHTYSIVEHPGSYAILAQPDRDSVVLIRQYRAPAGRELLEIPAGTVEPGEEPEAGARRELAEETGYRAGRIQEVFAAYPTPGFCTEFMRFFHATELQPGATAFDSEESIRTEIVSLDRALGLLDGGEIADVKTVAGLLWLDRWRHE
jgi:ADP-ribose pyrophosphatase